MTKKFFDENYPSFVQAKEILDRIKEIQMIDCKGKYWERKKAVQSLMNKLNKIKTFEDYKKDKIEEEIVKETLSAEDEILVDDKQYYESNVFSKRMPNYRVKYNTPDGKRDASFLFEKNHEKSAETYIKPKID